MTSKVVNKVVSENKTVDVMPVIEAYVALKRKIKKLEDKAKADYEAFAEAAAAIEADGMKIGQAKIQLSRKPFQWEYSPKIVKADEAVKELKKNWQATHEADGGGEPVWKVVTNV